MIVLFTDSSGNPLHNITTIGNCLLNADSTMSFTKISTIVCIFVIVREFRPVEPFLAVYLTSPPINLTEKQVNEEIYPVGTYASFVFVTGLFLITDYVRYKPIIILDGITGIFTYVLLLGKPSMTRYMIEQIFYGFFYSSDVACNTYLYAKIEDPSQYQKITGYVRTSSLFGQFIRSVFSQTVVSFGAMKESSLMYASIGGMVLATICTFIIPSVDRSIYFHRAEKQETSKLASVGVNSNIKLENIGNCDLAVKSRNLTTVLRHLLDDFKAAYWNVYVLKWSAWWSFSACGYYFVSTYSQVLWNVIVKQNTANEAVHMWNGAVESISTVLSAFAAYLISKIDFPWKHQGDWVLSFLTLSLSGFLFFSYWYRSIWLIYSAYIGYNAIYQSVLTVAQSEIAQHLRKDSYALIFGFNNLVALGLSSLVTYIAITGSILSFNTVEQFMFYSSYYFAIATIILCVAVKSSLSRKNVSSASLEHLVSRHLGLR